MDIAIVLPLSNHILNSSSRESGVESRATGPYRPTFGGIVMGSSSSGRPKQNVWTDRLTEGPPMGKYPGSP